ncbi:SDR family NAD(P)-dependent oxidoreductase [Yinghuangia sp. ASG 101]|uniref:type I polyketide synthase n=1 Tax=Yinghuangia sp. ASG 101 TaxID=2896848 RepID=UPI001E41953B|nr:type I polyketide synthase [Yinghuangia sp. ASG 101]UGQ12399.1 SDR family NAD(P)-dependent oxidoreductase [Yinghuangia sp. ASG 101]
MTIKPGPATSSAERTPATTAVPEHDGEPDPGRDAVAVIGLACRLPQAPDPAAFWRLLRDGTDAITATPPDRRDADAPHDADPSVSGRTVTGHGGYLDHVDLFDADFFGISPREATAMDPQQRLALELAWEVCENAGIDPERLRGTRTGVYVGAMGDDYAALHHRTGADGITAHTLTGLSRGVIANRISYSLGFQGPSLAVDAAQASGLVAVHLACEALRRGDATTALAGGVNLNLVPESTVAAGKFGGLSPDGRSYTFDARANGYVRGEGGGLVLLKPLRDALADGDRVYCVIRGSAANNDGGGRSLTTPTAAAQEAVLRTAYERAGVPRESVQYVELHGTGTRVGDPVEAAALGAALGAGAGRAEDAPLVVGSAKTNVGHLEGAAGIVGFIKTALSIRHRRIPASLNFAAPNPDIPLGELRLAVPTRTGDWPRPDRPLIAGVSAFGMGGTNCHVVVAEPPARARRAGRPDGPAGVPDGLLAWPLSARTDDALREQAAKYAEFADAAVAAERTGGGVEPEDPADIAHALVRTRHTFARRAVALGRNRDELTRGLAALTDPSALSAAVVTGSASPGGLGFLFSGQGSQRPGMGRELASRHPVFAAALAEVTAALDAHLDRPLADVRDTDLVHETWHAQPALFAVEVALFRLLESWGVRADVLAGHSLGELSAAHVAGLWSLADAARVVAARGRLMRELALPGGAMLAVAVPEAELGELPGGVSVAAINGPASVVLSGDADTVAGLEELWRGRSARVSRLRVSHAFHSSHMDPMLDEFRAVLESVAYAEPSIPLVSNLTGERAGDEIRTADYWVRHVRETVRFADGVATARATGVTRFLEIGPDAALTGLSADSAPDGEVAVAAQRRDRAEDDALLTAVATLWAHGTDVDWSALLPAGSGRAVDLPTYAFQRKRFWIDTSAALQTPDTSARPPMPDTDDSAAPARRFAPGPDLPDRLVELVRTTIAVVLGHVTADTVDMTGAFGELGLDSLMSVELRDRLAAATGVRLPAALVYNHPTPDAVVRHLTDALDDPDLRAEHGSSGTDATGRAAADEPIAIVGMSCRLPGGVASPEELWDLVRDQVDAISGFPSDRGWDLDALYDPDPGRPGTSYARSGGFLHDAGAFDAAFFGISPREATAMDPQQRVLLETAWEAVERAGIDVSELRGTRTGVFVGAMPQEYGPRLHEPADGHDGYLLTGSTTSVASGRVSYTLGLEGPAVTVDTACSSSLVALHLASQALRQGECTMALAGGVTVMATPGMFVEFSRQRGLAPDGRCKAFAAGANGTGWAEGAGMLLLERLSDARRRGHRVLAVVRGSAVNQDGASNGLTAPNGPAQERVLRTALENARLTPAQVDAVEAHGTGTSLGDPIEAEALIATYGRDRDPEAPLWLGSLKSNIGHAQAAAGVAGVIKMVMAMRHGVLPRTLHVDEPSPHVDWSAGAVALLTESRAWPARSEPRRAGVSSFGISGTNAHVILEQADDEHAAVPGDFPAEAPASAALADAGAPADPGTPTDADGPGNRTADAVEDRVVPWILSARTPEAVRESAARLARRAQREDGDRPDHRDVARALVTGRCVFAERAVAFGRTGGQLTTALAALASPSPASGPGFVSAAASPGGLGFLFSGQGSQRLGMGRELAARFPVFAEVLAEVSAVLDVHLDRPLAEVWDSGLVHETWWAQPALFAVEVALFRLLEDWGVRPDVLVGHSIGELAAAHVAGLWSLDDAARVVVARGRLMRERAVPGGAMLAVAVPETELGALPDGVSVAAVNGLAAVVLSGDADAIAGLEESWRGRGVRVSRLRVSHAFHSSHMDPMLDAFRTVLESVAYAEPSLHLVSNLTGQRAGDEVRTPDYWVRHVREAVRFADGVATARDLGATRFLEVGPDAALSGLLADSAPEGEVAVAALRRGRPEDDVLLTAAATLWVHGTDVDWRAIVPATGRHADLPTYPFQRRTYWLAPPTPGADVTAAGLAASEHPFLHAVVGLADAEGQLFTGRLALADHPWLADHAVGGTVLVPGTAFVELALHAGLIAGTPVVRELTVETPLVLTENARVDVQVAVSAPDDRGDRTLTVHARPADAAGGAYDVRADGLDTVPWTRHATGLLSADTPGPVAALPADAAREFAAWPPSEAEAVDVAEAYDRLAARGYGYGAAFTGLRALWRRADGRILAEVALTEPVAAQAREFGVHPALLDAVLHAALGVEADDAALRLPFAWSGIRLAATGASTLRVCVDTNGAGGLRISAADAAGDPVLSVDALVLRESSGKVAAAPRPGPDALLAVDWIPTGSGEVPENGHPFDPGAYAVIGPDTSASGGAHHADHAALTAAIAAGTHPAPAWVFVELPTPAEKSDDVPAAVRDSAAFALELMRWWTDAAATDEFADSRLVLVTQEAWAIARTTEADEPPSRVNPAATAAWGLVRSAMLEAAAPERILLLDLPSSAAGADPLGGALDRTALVARIARSDGESQFALRGNDLLVPRLTHANTAAHDDSAPPERQLPSDGTVLITGGTGTLGAIIARHLVTRYGVRHLLLVGRRGAEAPGARALEAELTAEGASVAFAACDVADRDAVAQMLAAVPDAHPLSAVVHLAGIGDDGVIASLTPERLARVLAAKADAAWHLHELTRDQGTELAAFVLFSSVTATLGSAGQANYAAANAALDALAAHRRGQGLHALALGWGLWEESGGVTAAMTETDVARLRRSGIAPLRTDAALRLFDTAFAAAARADTPPHLLPASWDLRALRTRDGETHDVPALFRGLVRERPRRAARENVGTAASAPGLAARLAALPDDERDRELLDLVSAQVAAVLGHAGTELIAGDKAFKELGFDSLTGVELRNRLGTVTGLRLPVTTTFDYPSPTALAGFLGTELLRGMGGSAPNPDAAHARGAAPATVRDDELLAIVGMSCRFPGGVASPDDLWRLVASGGDAIGAWPSDRGWDVDSLYDPDPERSGTSYTRDGGFLYDAARFDADFFGVSPREAAATDPQQRLLLETAWEAFEHAGIDPEELRGSATGVFAGVMYFDYGARLGSAPEEAEGYLLGGNLGSVATGRVAYTFGLEGPAVTVDTACSSSLVALHLAGQALRNGECSLALVGGVTVMSTPTTFVEFSRQRGLSPDGRCKAYGAGADGTGWGEGVGLLVVERLSDARRNGRRVLAVVRGTAVNQDGASNGMTAPNGPSQQRVIRGALASAGLSAADVDVVEGHGTGTRLGDPIEAQALLATYGRERRAGGEPLFLGSLKSNIGHAQAAAGVGGVIKMVMAMRHGVLPRTLHVDEPSPHVAWDDGAVALLAEERAWPVTGEPRRAGVSSFGISGTNAHVILEQGDDESETGTGGSPVGDAASGAVHGADEQRGVGPGIEEETDADADVAAEPEADRRESAVGAALDGAPVVVPWVISARTPEAVRESAARLAGVIGADTGAERRGGARDADIARALVTDRHVFGERAVVVARDGAGLAAALDGLVSSSARSGPGFVSGAVSSGELGFLFSGQGSQRLGMGRELALRFPVFAEALAEVSAALDAHLDRPLAEVWDTDLVHETWFAQPALFAVEVALFRLLEQWGVRPDVLVGHSVGELAAAYVAGLWSLEDAARVVVARGRLMRELAVPGGAMLAVAVPEAEVGVLPDGVSVAAVNGPGAVVLSGDAEAIGDVERLWRARGVRVSRLRVSHAFHSSHMDPMLDAFRAVLASVAYAEPRIPLVSNLTGERAGEEIRTPDYWVRHVREAVRFADGVRTARESGVTRFLEVGPDAALSGLLADGAPDGEIAVAALRRGRPEDEVLLTAVATLWVHGSDVDWRAIVPATGRRVDLPTYPFQHERYWIDASDDRPTDVAAAGLGLADHAFLSAVVAPAGSDTTVFTGRLSSEAHPWLADHAVLDTVLLPGTALADMAVHAGDALGVPVLADFTLEAALGIPEQGAIQVHVVVGPADDAGDGSRVVAVHARPDPGTGPEVDAGADWRRHAVGRLVTGVAPPAAEPPTAWPPPHAAPIPVADVYRELADTGFGYGPVFRGLAGAWRDRADDRTAYAEVRLPDDADTTGFGIHPALWDAALHTVFVLGGTARLRVPFAWSHVTVAAAGARALRVRMTETGPDAVSVTAVAESGELVLHIGELVLREVAGRELAAAVAPEDDTLYRLDWFPLASAAGQVDAAPPRIDAALAVGGPARGPAGATPEAALRAVSNVLAALRDDLTTDAAEPAAASPRIVLTRHAVRVRDADAGAIDPAGAAVWGLVRSAQAENPGRFVLLDLDTGADAEGDPAAPSPELLARIAASGEPQVAIRGGHAFVPRLVRDTDPAPRDPVPPEPLGGGTVLVTGASGALGVLMARHIAETYAPARLLLVSRRGESAPGAAELAAELRTSGVAVDFASCDVADRASLAQVLEAVPDDFPLRGVVHAAGVLDDGVLTSLDEARVAGVFRPKVDAAWHLDALTRDHDLAFFALFSSVAGVLGTAGQGNYAAANAYLDALAVRRTAEGLPATSYAWGLWESTSGMGEQLGAADVARIGRQGIAELPVDRGLALFDRGLASGHATVVAAALDLAGLREAALPVLLSRLVRGGGRRRVVTTRRDTGAADGLAGRLIGLGEPEQRRMVVELVARRVADVLGHRSAASVDAGRAFTDAGFDSLTAVELRNVLQAETGVALPATAVFDHPTPGALAEFLWRELAGAAEQGVPVSAPRDLVDDDPVVIVGMACRYPGGVASPEDLWDLVRRGGDAIGGLPDNRGWDLDTLFHPDPDHAGTTYSRSGGFLYDADTFDPEFFGMSPREALATDPQQRLLLETAWEVFENAGIDPATLRGSSAGVFTGVMYDDYGSRLREAPDGFEGYLVSGSAGSVASGRIAYTFGLEGPAVTVDTACSSSLVALHLAGQALRSGECDVALAGGVTVMATPATFVEFSRQRGLSPDGRCKAYGAGADGTGWGEGVGLVLVERLSDARRLGHRVLAVVRGSAVNQDGASNGLTAPNGPSQQRVIRRALAGAGLSAADVDVVEGHGTGTRLGDPIEAQALLATYGCERRAGGEPLWLGSLKSNIGHTQAAAGVAGVIKMVMAMRHGVLPRTLHVDEPSPHVDWSAGAVELLTEARPWPESSGPRRAAVSSFGISGTNAHVILEQADEADEFTARDEPAEVPSTALVPWPLSARNAAALRDVASRLGRVVGGADAAQVAHALATSRHGFTERAVALGNDAAALANRLTDLAGPDTAAARVVTGVVSPGGLGFLFSGQGSQRPGMARELAARFPVFAEVLAEVSAVLDVHLDRPLAEVWDSGLVHETWWAQPALFAVEVALFRLLEDWGVRPDVLVGHSIGELAAAHVAGVWSLEDAARVVVARGRLMRERAVPGGAMLAVAVPEAEVGALPASVSVAAVNGPASVVLSGDGDAIDGLEELWRGRGVRVSRLRVSHAFHSSHMDPMLEEFRAVLESVAYAEPSVPLVSNLSGEVAGDEILTPDYWVRHVRDAVRFSDGIATARATGVTRFLEVGPDAALSGLLADGAPDHETVVAAQRRSRPEEETLVAAVATLWAHGTDVDWPALLAAVRPGPVQDGWRRFDLPTYPFQRKRYWLDEPPTGTGDRAASGHRGTGHPLLGAAFDLPDGGGVLLTGRISPRAHPWLADHTVAGTIVVPGTALVDLVLAAGARTGTPRVDDLTLETPLVLTEDEAVVLHVVVGDPDATDGRTVTVHSRPDAAADDPPAWRRHAVGRLLRPGEAAVAERDMAAWPPPGAVPVPVDGLYAELASVGFGYGPTFSGLRAAWRDPDSGDVLAEAALPESAEVAGFGIHPALWDAALHAVFVAQGTSPLRVPFTWSDVVIHTNGIQAARVRVTASGSGTPTETVSVRVTDEHGTPVATIGGLALREVTPEQLREAAAAATPFGRLADDLLAVAWEAVPAAGPPERSVVDGVVHRVPVDASPPDAASSVLDVIHAGRAGDHDRLLVVTRHAVAAREFETVASLGGAAVWGLVRSAQSEDSGGILLLDIDDDLGPDELLARADEMARLDLTQAALRDGTLHAPRLKRVPLPSAAARTPEPVADGTVLVTGASGALGGLVARHLVARYGVRRLVLASRRGASAPGAVALEAELAAHGASVVFASVDVGDRDAVAGLMAEIPTEFPLRGVVHAAGVLDDGVVASLDAERLARVFRPKVDAAWHLHELTRDQNLAFFVLFSSAAGVLGNAGQGNYAAANTFLDGLAAYRRGLGLPAVSLAWGLWAAEASGMGGTLAASETARLARAGVVPIEHDHGLALFDAALAVDKAALVPLSLDRSALRVQAASGTLPHILRGLVATPRPASAPALATEPPFASRVAVLPEAERHREIMALVRTNIAAVLVMDGPDAVPTDRGLLDLGFDSLTAVDLRNRLGAATGLRLPTTLAFDHPTPLALATHLAGEFAAATAPTAEAAAPGDVATALTDLERALDLASHGVAPEDRAALSTRLRALAQRLATPDAAPDTAPHTAEHINEATDDEIFDFIDKELGT